MIIHILAAGASKGLVLNLQARFTSETGYEIDGVFNAVGSIREKFVAGDVCDVLILTAKQIAELTIEGLLVPGSAKPLGAVSTGVAVPMSHAAPDISTAPGLAAALQLAKGIYIPDPYNSTAGIHFMKILKKLGIDEKVAPYLKPYPNGATAMRHLADSSAENAIGSTQITEIKYTPGLALVGALPPEFGLSTVYSAAVSAKAIHPQAAHLLVDLLTGGSTQILREQSGFEIPTE